MKPLSCRCLAKVNPNPESQPVISTALLPICKTKQNKMHWNWVFEISDLQYTEQITSLSRSSLFQDVLYTRCQLLPPSVSWTQEMTVSYQVHPVRQDHCPPNTEEFSTSGNRLPRQTDQANHHALAVHIHLEIWKYTRQFPRHVFPSSGTDPICSKQAGVHSSVHAAHRPWRRQFDWRKDMV